MTVTSELVGQAGIRHFGGGHFVSGPGQYQLIETSDGRGVLNVAIKRRLGRSSWANTIPCSSIRSVRGGPNSTTVEYAGNGLLQLQGPDHIRLRTRLEAELQRRRDPSASSSKPNSTSTVESGSAKVSSWAAPCGPPVDGSQVKTSSGALAVDRQFATHHDAVRGRTPPEPRLPSPPAPPPWRPVTTPARSDTSASSVAGGVSISQYRAPSQPHRPVAAAGPVTISTPQVWGAACAAVIVIGAFLPWYQLSVGVLTCSGPT